MSFTAFLKKEVTEAYKTPKGIIIGIIFLFFGILSPLTAKYMNEIIALAGQQQGMDIKLPPSTYLQSYEQFFKNIYFMMTVVTILVFAGMVSEEKSRGTIVLVLTKCLSRQAFILGKLISAVLIFSVSYIVATGVCVFYTALMFPEYMNSGIIYALLLYWLFGCMMITLTLLVSILSKSMTVAAVSGFASYALISTISAIPYIGKYTPGSLQSLSWELAHNTKTPADALIPALITFAAGVVAIAAGLAIFRKQEL
jgi:ABC-2 type transport system permease protein